MSLSLQQLPLKVQLESGSVSVGKAIVRHGSHVSLLVFTPFTVVCVSSYGNLTMAYMAAQGCAVLVQ
jgi:hypothetical protein